jgi:elongation factor G
MNRNTTPILWMPIFAVTSEDRRRLPEALAAIGRDDPAVLVRRPPESEELLYSGTSVDHLTQTFRRIFDEMQIPSWTGQPRVRYVETIRAGAEAEGKYIRQTGGSGNYGHVKLRVDPSERGAGLEFRSEIQGGVIPPQFIPPIEAGIREAAAGGILAGHEVVDFKATVFDGSYHETDSNHVAFQIAASLAFKEAARKARPTVLEPVMTVVFTVSESRLGGILAEISVRRGRVTSASSLRGASIVQASIPLAEMLRDVDPAPASFVFEGFEPVSSDRGGDAGAMMRQPNLPHPTTGPAAAADPEFDWT